jgi:hypothetical protein
MLSCINCNDRDDEIEEFTNSQPVLWYDFTNGLTNKGSSGSINNLVINNPGSNTRVTNKNDISIPVLALDNQSTVTVNGRFSVNPQNFVIAFWINPNYIFDDYTDINGNNYDENIGPLFSFKDNNSSKYINLLHPTGGFFNVLTLETTNNHDPKTENGYCSIEFDSTSSIHQDGRGEVGNRLHRGGVTIPIDGGIKQQNKWFHVAYVVNNGIVKRYYNGCLQFIHETRTIINELKVNYNINKDVYGNYEETDRNYYNINSFSLFNLPQLSRNGGNKATKRTNPKPRYLADFRFYTDVNLSDQDIFDIYCPPDVNYNTRNGININNSIDNPYIWYDFTQANNGIIPNKSPINSNNDGTYNLSTPNINNKNLIQVRSHASLIPQPFLYHINNNEFDDTPTYKMYNYDKKTYNKMIISYDYLRKNGYTDPSIDYSDGLKNLSCFTLGPTPLFVNSQFSISFWAYTGNQNNGDAPNYYSELINIFSPSFNFSIDPINNDLLNINTYRSNQNFSFDSNMHHYVFVYDGSLKYYKDGVGNYLKKTSKNSTEILKFNISNLTAFTNSYFSGLFNNDLFYSDFRLYQYALSDADVTTLYSIYGNPLITKPPPPPPTQPPIIVNAYIPPAPPAPPAIIPTEPPPPPPTTPPPPPPIPMKPIDQILSQLSKA